ncbi:transglutaminase-like cysteine peptidase [Desulfobacterota bacterium M19]
MERLHKTFRCLFTGHSSSRHFLALLLATLFISGLTSSPAAAHPRIFNYKEVPEHDMQYLPQWLSVLERHITEDVPDGNCTESFFNRCHLNEWFAFLAKIKNEPQAQQLKAVNRYANQKKYVLDIDNYGVEDYWAIPKQFLARGGDCEDYAITKFFSLRWLGYGPDKIRLLILQDTNLRVQHAVLLFLTRNDILVLDNQSQEIVSQKLIHHYVPLYSLNEKEWWLHVPPVSTP